MREEKTRTEPAGGALDGRLEAIRRVAGQAERRIRLRRSLAAGVSSLCVSLVLACVTLGLRKTSVVSETVAREALAALAAVPLLAVLAVFARRLDTQPGRAGAIALDRFHGLADRLSSALSFAREGALTPFMLAAIDDAVVRVPSVDPRRAVPMAAPPHLAPAGLLACALLAITLFEVRGHVPAAHVQTIDAVDVTADDLDAMREFLDQMKSRDQTDEAKAATREFNQLIEDLAARRLDRTEAFRRMQQLEDKLLEGREADAKALEDAMKKIGDEMKAAELTKPAGEALASKNLAAAEKQLQELAKKLREQGKQVDKGQLEKMRDALKRASSSQSKRQEALAQRREELRQQLLSQRNKKSDAGADDEERSLLQKRERELDRLERETQQSEATGRQLDRLDRELSKAAEDLMKDLGLSAEDLEKSAEDINRMKKEEMTQEEKEQLRQKLEELREMMRQQGQGGQGQMARLRRFQMQARGKGGGSQGGQEGQDGQQDQQGQGDGQGQGQQGQGQSGQGGKPQSSGGAGKGERGSGGGETWVLGPNGQRMLMLSQGRSGASATGGEGDQPGGGKAWGTGHDAHVEGKVATKGMSSQQDTQVAGQDTGQGASRSEVIEGAAERGFASRGYQKVFREYQTVAEEALGKDEIPGGYRFYVRRYFDLIRPRDEHEAAPGGSESSPSAARP